MRFEKAISVRVKFFFFVFFLSFMNDLFFHFFLNQYHSAIFAGQNLSSISLSSVFLASIYKAERTEQSDNLIAVAYSPALHPEASNM